MSTLVVDPTFLKDLKKIGPLDASACFNCGNCTAVCPLSIANDAFPRKMIRLAQIGASERLMAHKELWLCYYCGTCSDTCPRQADPGEFMAVARRWVIASFDPTGIARMLYTSKIFTWVFMAALTAIFALFLLAGAGPMKKDSPQLFAGHESSAGFLQSDMIHNMGLIVIAIAVLATVVGLVRMVMRLSKALPHPPEQEENASKRPGFIGRLIKGFKVTITELAAHKRFRDCNEDEKAAPWYRSRWFVHWSIMWGFIMLGVVTGIDFLLVLVADKIPGQPVPLWHPTRLLGTVFGLLLLYGTSVAIISRIIKPDKYSSHSLLSDWLFIWLLFLCPLTGFLTEIALYLPAGATWGYISFLVHVILGMEIVILLPFTKFAHAMYRPLALLVHNMRE